jgi:hypothetical protein
MLFPLLFSFQFMLMFISLLSHKGITFVQQSSSQRIQMSDLVDSDSSQISEPLISRRSSGGRQWRKTNERTQVVHLSRGRLRNSSGGLRKPGQVPSHNTQQPSREPTVRRVISRPKTRHPRRDSTHDPPVRTVFGAPPQDPPRRSPLVPRNPLAAED